MEDAMGCGEEKERLFELSASATRQPSVITENNSNRLSSAITGHIGTVAPVSKTTLLSSSSRRSSTVGTSSAKQTYNNIKLSFQGDKLPSEIIRAITPIEFARNVNLQNA